MPCKKGLVSGANRPGTQQNAISLQLTKAQNWHAEVSATQHPLFYRVAHCGCSVATETSPAPAWTWQGFAGLEPRQLRMRAHHRQRPRDRRLCREAGRVAPQVSHEWCEQVPHCCSPTTARPHAGPRAPALLECCYYNLSPRRTLSCTQNLPSETPLPRPPGERSAEVVPHSKWQKWAHSPFTGFSRYGAERKLRSASTLARRQGPASPVSMLMSASETLLGVPRAFTIGTEP